MTILIFKFWVTWWRSAHVTDTLAYIIFAKFAFLSIDQLFLLIPTTKMYLTLQPLLVSQGLAISKKTRNGNRLDNPWWNYYFSTRPPGSCWTHGFSSQTAIMLAWFLLPWVLRWQLSWSPLKQCWSNQVDYNKLLFM